MKVKKNKSEMHLGFQRGLKRREAIDGAATSSRLCPPQPLQAAPPVRELPASVGSANLMIANWVVGKRCDPTALDDKLQFAPFDLVVLVLSTAVAATDDISLHLQFLASGVSRSETLGEKAVFKVTGKIFEALHRAKV